MPGALHEQAVDILDRHMVEAIGGELMVDTTCNECPERHPVDLMPGVATVVRGQRVGPVIPDLALCDAGGHPITFVEVVDSHAPNERVHLYAVEQGVQIVEFHLRAGDQSSGRRRRAAVSQALTIKVRLDEFRSGHLRADEHNLLCPRPRCAECHAPLPRRTIRIQTKDCWSCDQNVRVAVGHMDSGDLRAEDFTDGERAFVELHGVMLDRRYSHTAERRYLANVCPACDQMQGEWYLYTDPYHSRFIITDAEREGYGPCNACSTYYCAPHGEYRDYGSDPNCPECLHEAERVFCREGVARECFYPQTCQAEGCYFVRNGRCLHCGRSSDWLRRGPSGAVACGHCGTLQE